MTYPSVFEPGPLGNGLVPAPSPDAPSTLDYIADMAAELAGLALGVGQAGVAELLARAAETARERD